jgi:hypothetical protein
MGAVWVLGGSWTGGERRGRWGVCVWGGERARRGQSWHCFTLTLAPNPLTISPPPPPPFPHPFPHPFPPPPPSLNETYRYLCHSLVQNCVYPHGKVVGTSLDTFSALIRHFKVRV